MIFNLLGTSPARRKELYAKLCTQFFYLALGVIMKTRRVDAILAKEPFYLTGKQCLNGHISKRNTIDGSCHQCRIDKQRKFREAIKNG